MSRTTHDVALQGARSILAGDGIGYFVPSRSAQNQHYVPELDRIVLKVGGNSLLASRLPERTALTEMMFRTAKQDSERVRKFGNRAEVRKVSIMSRLMQVSAQSVNN